MKRLSVLTFISIIQIYNLKAQPVVTSSSFPKSGVVLKYSIGSTATPMVIKSGTDAIWDFSKIKFESESEIEYCDPNVAKETNKFPEGNIAFRAKPSSTNYTFLKINNEIVEYLGFVVAMENYTYEAIYNDPWIWYKLPLKYKDNFFDTYSVNTSMKVNGETIDYFFKGEYSYHVDGFGTLITPYKKIPNVLRITADIYESDSAIFRNHNDSISVNKNHFQKISWISSEPGNYFEIVSTFDSKDFFLAEKMTSPALGVRENVEKKPEMKIYPDPVENKLNVELNNISDSHFDILIINSLGEIIKRFEVNQSRNDLLRWNTTVSDLSPGMYHIQFRSEKNQWNGSFFKQ
jgi:hypothetical protein